MIFLKLGGSLITDKTGIEAVREDTLQRLAAELASAWRGLGGESLVLGHGSGSFGHVAAARHGTRGGVQGAAQWLGFAEVADAAARLNRRVVGALVAQGVPALSLAPSAVGRSRGGELADLAGEAISHALAAGILPVVYGDVAFDDARGGTIVSTEEVFGFLARRLAPKGFLLAGDVPGVLDGDGKVIGRITPDTVSAVLPHLGGSRGTDVTGGMASKVAAMLSLVRDVPGLSVRIFSGLEPGLIRLALLGETDAGTLITAG